jgi:hypothetical protein
MAACRLGEFEGTFAEIEPDFDAFVRGFTVFDRPDPSTLRYGRWLNPVGYWDWWELGGRFNGAITGEPRPASAEQAISSGPSPGRAGSFKWSVASPRHIIAEIVCLDI